MSEQNRVKVSLRADGPDYTTAYLYINDAEIGCCVEVAEVRVASREVNKVTLAFNPDELEIDLPVEKLHIVSPRERNRRGWRSFLPLRSASSAFPR